MVQIAGGTFLIGNPIADPDAKAFRSVERPQREVHVDGFWLARCLVTTREFCLFLDEVGNQGYFVDQSTAFIDWGTIRATDRGYAAKPGAEQTPAMMVTWTGAAAYCAWLSHKLGDDYRLPTEAEWEFAARGPELRAWPWGDEPPDASRGGRWIRRTWDQHRPWPMEAVGSFAKNATPAGVCDLLGYECPQWCADRAERAIARLPGTPAPMYVTRGRGTVVTGYDEERRGITLRKLVEFVLNAGEAGQEYDTTDGRSWSRVGEHRSAGGMFRVAASHAP
jgi:formylglycine-generating enzyme required for sulfatase activity